MDTANSTKLTVISIPQLYHNTSIVEGEWLNYCKFISKGKKSQTKIYVEWCTDVQVNLQFKCNFVGNYFANGLDNPSTVKYSWNLAFI